MPRSSKKNQEQLETIEPIPVKPLKKTSSRKSQSKKTETLPLLAIRDAVHFPDVLAPLLVGRERSVRALEIALQSNRRLFVVAQKDVAVDDPSYDDLCTVGVISEAVQALPVPDGTMRVVLRGLERATLKGLVSEDPYLVAEVERVKIEPCSGPEIEGLMRECVLHFERIVQIGRQIPPEAVPSIMYIDEPGRLADSIAHHLTVRLTAKQHILEISDVRERLEALVHLLVRELEILEVQQQIRSRVEKEMGETQREYYLREQLKVIQHELGERDDRGSEIDDYRDKVKNAKMPEDIEERALKELDRLEKMPSVAPEGGVIRNYLDWLVALPWKVKTDDTVDVSAAAKILDEDHYGLMKVKERILEFLAISQLSGSLKGPILCLVGPPGVGKTSIGRGIARSLGRKFIRISLGGVRDEAEIRGHRRTYVGSLPGRIIQGVRNAQTRNPVFMLDEIDKLGIDFRGDPTAALLEALDPEQNDKFSDHYLEVPFDLSDVMFITTANLLENIPNTLRDRMEVIHFPGYTEEEKLNIAMNFLVSKKIAEHGLKPAQIHFHDDALRLIIREYTREAGVRNLEREIATVCRKIARKIAEKKIKKGDVKVKTIPEYLGKPRFHYGVIEEHDEIAAVTGLVYTEFGGDIVTVEVSLVPSTEGELILTGQLGNVMRESAQAALTYIRSRAVALKADPEFNHKHDIHVHVPAGGVPKDGPSAGITMATALASAVTGLPVRKDVAMTGEITLRGKVLPIGGIKEKILAAHRAGITTVILPYENEKDLDEIASPVRASMTFKLVRHMDEVLELALVKKKTSPKL
ncbi:MAG: endopeptidase La [bacterium]